MLLEHHRAQLGELGLAPDGGSQRLRQAARRALGPDRREGRGQVGGRRLEDPDPLGHVLEAVLAEVQELQVRVGAEQAGGGLGHEHLTGVRRPGQPTCLLDVEPDVAVLVPLGEPVCTPIRVPTCASSGSVTVRSDRCASRAAATASSAVAKTTENDVDSALSSRPRCARHALRQTSRCCSRISSHDGPRSRICWADASASAITRVTVPVGRAAKRGRAAPGVQVAHVARLGQAAHRPQDRIGVVEERAVERVERRRQVVDRPGRGS